MRCKELFQHIDDLNGKYLSVWEDVCNIESPTACKAGVDAVGSYFIRLAAHHGWTVETLPQSVSGDAICITMNADAAGAPVSLSGHMDTVHPVGLFGAPAVTKDETHLYGPGVADCKGGIVAGFLAMDALEKAGFTTRPVRMLLQSDEENGSSTSGKATIDWICEKAKGSAAFLNLEPILEGSEGKATVARKGLVDFRFTVTGQAAHSSRCATEGASAICEAAHKILELETYKDADGITCNCGVISGGTVVNAVAASCTFGVNFRFSDKAQEAQIQELVRRVAETVHVPGCTCTVEQTGHRIAMEETARNYALLDTMNDIYETNGMSRLAPRKVNGGADSAEVTAAGIPCVDSLGVVGGKIHSRDEYAVMTSLCDSAKRIAAVVCCM
ncbi:MAG: M20/M25/M40 family metallo-hydrolase [Oscillospiraceae bacterium]|nr:M20/M25/M40 family metallo-hydrolase [Oscillospiraceae bacterium]